MKIRFDAETLDLGYRTVPVGEIRGLSIETDRRRGWLVYALWILTGLLAFAGFVKVLSSDRPGWAFVYLIGCVVGLALKGHGLVQALSRQEGFFTLWAETAEGRLRVCSVGDGDFLKQVHATFDEVRRGRRGGQWVIDPAWGTLEEEPAGPKGAAEA